MNNTMYEKLKTEIIMHANHVNQYADDKDARRNATNYGFITGLSYTLKEMGHDIDIAVWDDEGFLRVPKVKIDGEVYTY